MQYFWFRNGRMLVPIPMVQGFSRQPWLKAALGEEVEAPYLQEKTADVLLLVSHSLYQSHPAIVAHICRVFVL